MMGQKVNGNVVLTDGSRKRLLENGGRGDFDLDVQPFKFKRRSLSAKRDFPKGCGRFAVWFDVKLNGKGVVGSAEKLEEEEEDVPSASLEPMYVDALTVLEKPLKASKSGREGVSKNLHRTKLSDCMSDTDESTSKDLQINASPSEEKELTSSLALKLQVDSVTRDRAVKLEISGDPKPSVSAYVLARRMSEKFLPPRRISACRDFPPGCGRTATHANPESCQTLAGSFNNGSKLKLKDTSCKRKFPEKSSSESPGIRQSQGKGYEFSEDRVIVYTLMAKPNCPWRQGKKTSTPLSGNQSQVIENTSQSVIGNQHKMEEYVGSELSDDRKIVMALMAAPNCPWRHGKRPFKAQAPADQPKQRSKFLW